MKESIAYYKCERCKDVFAIKICAGMEENDIPSVIPCFKCGSIAHKGHFIETPEPMYRFKQTIAYELEEVKSKDVIVHGVMRYECEHCKTGFPVYVEKGVEEFGENHMPTPFMTLCPFCKEGLVQDVSGMTAWKNAGFNKYVRLVPRQYYFANTGDKVAHLRYLNKDGQIVNPYEVDT